ncbi:hypothetical protein LX81_03451 [Palleronia aestuarii]|uniref:Uncharacterized protein n=2 Tax=Palleronia aestuarii TaxID=568105 RepID=A0A2W7MYJ8_9RHOB|nr:hypothetical protein LX81_03451 [Palleronia aestuarii]
MDAILFLTFLIWLATPVPEAPAWEASYYEAQHGDEMSVCLAGVVSPSSRFQLRIFDRQMDFYLHRTDFAIPLDQPLGDVYLDLAEEVYTLAVEPIPIAGDDVETNSLLLTPAHADYLDIVNGLRAGGVARLWFPDGSARNVDLAGSEAALLEVFECWDAHETGFAGGNPVEFPPAVQRVE